MVRLVMLNKEIDFYNKENKEHINYKVYNLMIHLIKKIYI